MNMTMFTYVGVGYVQRDLKLMVSFRFIALWRLSAQIYRYHFNFPPIAIIISGHQTTRETAERHVLTSALSIPSVSSVFDDR